MSSLFEAFKANFPYFSVMFSVFSLSSSTFYEIHLKHVNCLISQKATLDRHQVKYNALTDTFGFQALAIRGTPYY
jgi:hypothetical protein